MTFQPLWFIGAGVVITVSIPARTDASDSGSFQSPSTGCASASTSGW
jgi:hypothetical protein